MLRFLSRLFRRTPDAPEPGSLVEELWFGELTGSEEGRFLEADENGYAAHYAHERGAGKSASGRRGLDEPRLILELERPNLFAWTEAPVYRYSDFVLEGDFTIPPREPYSAAGFLFRYQDASDFYALLVSNKGFFRLDLVLSGKPRALIGWTELPDSLRSRWIGLPPGTGLEEDVPKETTSPGTELTTDAEPAKGKAAAIGLSSERQSFSLRVIARGEHFTVMVDDEWIAETVDDSFDSGYIAFAAQRYGDEASGDRAAPVGDSAPANPVRDRALTAPLIVAGSTATFELGSCMVESRPVEIESWYYRHNYYIVPEASARRRLAETFFAMGECLSAAVQLRKLERIRPLDADELFLKAESALRLGLQDEAEAALEACLALAPGRDDAAEEKANLLYLRGRYLELRDELAKLLPSRRDNPRLLCLSGHARFNLGDFAGAGADYRAAADLEGEDSAGAALGRMNEARAWDQAGKKEEAAEAYLKAARLLASQGADDDLDLALGRIAALRPRNLEAKAIRAKALYRRGKRDEAAKLLTELAAKGAADSGSRYTLGLILAEKGENDEAIEQFAAALELEPEYPLYAFRYAERLYIACQTSTAEGESGDADPATERSAARAATRRAVELAPAEGQLRGWIYNLAGQEALSRGDLEAARVDLDIALAALPEAPEIAINIADLESRLGHTDLSLAALSPFPEHAACRNQAGNVYARAAMSARRDSAQQDAAVGDSARPTGTGRDSAQQDAAAGDSARFASARSADDLLELAVREYLRATNLEPYSAEYQANLAAAYIELERYADAEERLRKALDLGGGVRALFLTGNLAQIYGDLPRAEAAYRMGLESSPEDLSLLAALGRTYLSLRQYAKAESIAKKLKGVAPERAARLGAEILEATTEPLSCSGCGRAWRVPRELPAQSGATIRAMPPDDSPAGACPRCGKVFCIACRKDALSEDNRFTCPDCGETLKLADARLRYLVRESLRRKLAY
jgi:tetratricopeptide (TPR) repeat protein